MKTISKSQFWDYFLLSARVLLAWTLLRYGWSKLTDNQFGVDEKTLDMPLKNVSLFKLSWYLADHQPFKAFVGVSQLATGLMMILNRTAIIGVVMSIPIWLNILAWDLTFMEGFTSAFAIRLTYYLILTALILYHNKFRVVPAVKTLTIYNSAFSYPIWAYAILPITAIVIEGIGGIPNALVYYIRMLGL